MNKYAAVGLAVAAAVEGRRILVICQRGNGVRAALDELRAVDLVATEKVTLANGAERITYPGGGSIRFATTQGSRHRGVSADTVYLDGIDPYNDHGLLHELRACVAASSKTGEIVRA